MRPGEPKGPNVLDTATAAALLEVTPRWLQQLAKDGWIKPAGRGQWPLISTVQGYIRSLKDESAKKAKAAGESDLRRARAREVEQRIAIRDRRLIDLEEHDGVVDEAFGMLKAELLGIPARLTRDLEMRRKIEMEIHGALNRTAARVEQAGAQLRATGQAAQATAEDDA